MKCRVPGPVAGNAALVEAGGQFTRGFRCGLDYAFILWRASLSMYAADAERVIRLFTLEPNPGARPACVVACFGESMSLYRAGLKLAFFLPLGVAIPLLE
ncbi:MAG: hypothetical protein WDO68_25705 [Gammaproteobacteria bacterium]